MLFDIASRIGLLFLFGITLFLLWTAATVAVCAITQIKLDKIAIFFGKPVITFQTRLCPLSIGSIPMGAYVNRDMKQFSTHPLAIRWLMILAGPSAVVLSAVLCI